MRLFLAAKTAQTIRCTCGSDLQTPLI
ncbi:hypothetical protein FHI69_02800 [Janthinobacterium lividum]|uniref:Uncharacterized protein n=1 Tax=Janthinobacterium lividum TaxID=29581 RepID=A0A5C4NXC3_9BURK|nr:hypothetical protein FHI69_02800 [Janthinobacterium lividum]